MERGKALEGKEENTMKKYTVKPEYADQIFGGECDTAYVEECMKNGMPEEDVEFLVREYGEKVLEQFDIEDIPMTVYGRAISDKDMQAIGSYMDDDIREDLHCDLAPCTHEEFIAAYLERDPEFENLLRTEFNFKREV